MPTRDEVLGWSPSAGASHPSAPRSTLPVPRPEHDKEKHGSQDSLRNRRHAGAAGLLVAGCSSSTTSGAPAGSAAPAASGSAAASSAAGTKKLSVVSVVNGLLGDASFFDDAERGIQKLKAFGPHHTDGAVGGQQPRPSGRPTSSRSRPASGTSSSAARRRWSTSSMRRRRVPQPEVHHLRRRTQADRPQPRVDPVQAERGLVPRGRCSVPW